MTMMLSNQRIDRVVGLNPPFPVPSEYQEAHTLSQKVSYLLSDAHDRLLGASSLLTTLHNDLPQTLNRAFVQEEHAALLEIHKVLYTIYEVSFSNPLSPMCIHEHSTWLGEIRNAIETAWLNYELPNIRTKLPTESEAKNYEMLCRWFVNQAKIQSDNDKYIVYYLENIASIEQFNLFILSDAHLNYRFYDALALAQHYFSEAVKAEIVHHMLDECGGGVLEKAHTVQFTRALIDLDIPQPLTPIWEDWRPYSGHNFYFCFGLNRKHYFKALGSLAMPELFDPDRNRAVVAGFDRLYSNSNLKCEYFYNHIEGDEEHGIRWLENIITPIVKIQPEAGMELAIGGALRMEAMRRYNEYLAMRFKMLEQKSPSGSV